MLTITMMVLGHEVFDLGLGLNVHPLHYAGLCKLIPSPETTCHHQQNVVGGIAYWLERWSRPATFPILRQTTSWMSDHFVVKPSAIVNQHGQLSHPSLRGR